MSLKRKHIESKGSSADPSLSSLDLFESSPIDDRASRFIALFSPNVVAPKDLQAHNAYKEASHRILAWRKPSKQQSLKSISATKAPVKVLHNVGSDDDGEKYAGKKLEKLLIEMNIVGTIVVARWYGGVFLGPARFDHIVNVAKEAIMNWQNSTTATIKKVKVDSEKILSPDQEAELKARLAKHLHDRDDNILVLRQLLAEKKAGTTTPTISQTPNSASSNPDYLAMSVARLRQLEKAKDTTIAWILKQIDESESSQIYPGDQGKAKT